MIQNELYNNYYEPDKILILTTSKLLWNMSSIILPDNSKTTN